MVLDVLQILRLRAASCAQDDSGRLGRDDRKRLGRDDSSRYFPDSALMTACAAARRAIGTRNGEHET